MYNNNIINNLKTICKEDTVFFKNQSKYAVADGFSKVEFYIDEKKFSYRVSGDAYITAMTKWLQKCLINSNDLSLITLPYLIEYFGIPQHKVRNAMQIINIIKKINAKK